MQSLYFIISSPIGKDLFDANLVGQDERSRLHMSDNIKTQEFRISDYDAALQIWEPIAPE